MPFAQRCGYFFILPPSTRRLLNQVSTVMSGQITLLSSVSYASWLNQIELWFSKMERDLIARGIFRSVGDLRRKIMRYIRHHNRTARPIRWVYRNPSHRITTTTHADVTGH